MISVLFAAFVAVATLFVNWVISPPSLVWDDPIELNLHLIPPSNESAVRVISRGVVLSTNGINEVRGVRVIFSALPNEVSIYSRNYSNRPTYRLLDDANGPHVYFPQIAGNSDLVLTASFWSYKFEDISIQGIEAENARVSKELVREMKIEDFWFDHVPFFLGHLLLITFVLSLSVQAFVAAIGSKRNAGGGERNDLNS